MPTHGFDQYRKGREMCLNTLLDATRPYETAVVDEVRTRAKELAAARPTTIAA